MAQVPTRIHAPLLLAALALAACGRSPLDLAAPPVVAIRDAAVVVEHPADLVIEPHPDVAPDLSLDFSREAVPEAPVERPPTEAGPVCHPQPETCNGVDDDCDGQIDQGLPPIPCPDGGNRYCVSGSYSQCPRRCEVCVPGSERECFTSFCTFWGVSFCASDGRSWSACKETSAPFECADVASKNKKTRELEQCCLDHGFCCLDEFDLDNDGETNDMVGRCDSAVCGP